MLGDRGKQDAIRTSYPGKHCDLLLASPFACDGCPKNPKQKKTERSMTSEQQDDFDVVHSTLRMVDYAELGLLGDLRNITPDQAIMLRIAKQKIAAQNRQDLANRIAMALMAGKQV